jgi:predicted HAD superfamily hydrolase
MTIKVFSFDVFDTCLVRTKAAPTDLFYDLARGLLASRDQDSREALHELAQARVEAEKRARIHANREDITIHAVYAHFHELKSWGLDPEQAKTLELELELAAVRPILAIRKRIEQARADGGRVIFISDMYLPQETIRAMLERHGLAQPEDRLYVSGQIGVCKGSGRLFDHVLAQEGIAPGEMLHSGDNLYSDISVPAAKGIRTAPYEGYRLSRYEMQMLSETEAHNWVRSAIAGTSRAVRLMHTTPEDSYHGLLSIAADVVAPFLTSYVAWVLEDAGRRGVEKLFFISRDGQIFYRIAQALSRHMDKAGHLPCLRVEGQHLR